MNVYDEVNSLARAIKESREYLEYKEIKEELYAKPEMKERIDEFEKIRYEEQLLAMQGEKQSDEKMKKLQELNNDNSINGILLQLPLPDGYDANKLLNTIDPIKDVDGLTRKSMGSMLSNEDGMIPCTPKGIIKILDFYGVELEGKSCCPVLLSFL